VILVCLARSLNGWLTGQVAYLPQMMTRITCVPRPNDICALQASNTQCYIALGGSFVSHAWVSLSAFTAK